MKEENLEQLKVVFKEEIKTFISIYGFVGNKAGNQKDFIDNLANSLVHEVRCKSREIKKLEEIQK